MRIIYVILIVFLFLSMEVYSIINPGVKPIKETNRNKENKLLYIERNRAR